VRTKPAVSAPASKPLGLHDHRRDPDGTLLAYATTSATPRASERGCTVNKHVLLMALLGGLLIALLKAVYTAFLVVEYSVESRTLRS